MGKNSNKEGIGMRSQRKHIRGLLLGLAVGDAMGCTVDRQSLSQIQEDYGPGGLQGYDLVNGYAEISSYTQLAAFACNGLLLAMTRGQMRGKMAPLVNYIGLSSREWALSQRPWGRPRKTYCWLMNQPELCRHRCMDTRMLDTLSKPTLGTLTEPENTASSATGITTALAVGMFRRLVRMSQEELNLLGAEAVALTHGGATAFLSGAALTHMVSLMIRDTDTSFRKAALDAAKAVREQFGHRYSQAFEVSSQITLAASLADDRATPPVQIMERLGCETAAQVLAGAVYAILVNDGNFDSALITAVNHSGRSGAVGAITGALLGLRMGEEALPEFYIECLEPADTLRELADDMFQGCTMDRSSKLFDLDWDRKYLHGGA